MKLIVSFLALALVQSLAIAVASQEKVEIALVKAFVPLGFDDNDNVQVVVAGVFPNTCFQIGPTEVIRTGMAEGRLEIRQSAYHSSSLCLQVRNPFYQVVDLGRLPQGSYSLVDETSQGRLGELSVSAAAVSPGPDDYPYAPVRDATVGQNRDGSRTLMLLGFYTDKCMKMRASPLIRYYPDVIVVQPVIEMAQRADCGPARIPFQEFYNLRSDAPASFLLHVRAMNGMAINKVFDFTTGH